MSYLCNSRFDQSGTGSLIEKRIGRLLQSVFRKKKYQKTSGSHFKNRDKKLKDFKVER